LCCRRFASLGRFRSLRSGRAPVDLALSRVPGVCAPGAEAGKNWMDGVWGFSSAPSHGAAPGRRASAGREYLKKTVKESPQWRRPPLSGPNRT